MAYLACEGFDHYNSVTDLQTRMGALQWSAVTASYVSIASPGRSGSGKCLSIVGPNGFGSGAGSATASLSSNYTTLYFAAPFTVPNAYLGSSPYVIELQDTTTGGSTQASILFSATGAITVYRGTTSGTVIGATAPNAVNLAVWNFVEIGFHIDASAGWVSIRTAAGPVTWTTNPNGVNTKGSSASATVGAISFIANNTYAYAGTMTVSIDDLRFNDTTTGPGLFPCNGFMGDMTVKTGFVNGNGTVTWTPNAGTNWQEISETAFDGDTTFNTTATVGNADTFNLTPWPTNISAIIAVDVIGGYRETDGGGHTMCNEMVTGGTIYQGATIALSTSYGFYVDSYAMNPATSLNWSLSDINAMQIGYKLLG